MDGDNFSALRAVHELRSTLLARLDQNEDYRVLRGLDLALRNVGQAPAAPIMPTNNAVRVMHEELRAQPPAPTPASSPAEPTQDSLVFSNLRTAS